MACRHEDSTSSEMRHDWLADRWVIIAPQRTCRPNDFVSRPPDAVDNPDCPFCLGHEAHTPEAVACYGKKRATNSANWSVRVVPNKFPAVNAAFQRAGVLASGESEPPVQGTEFSAAGDLEAIDLFRKHLLTGAHEVIVECPTHLQSISQLDRETMQLVFTAYRDRLHFWLDQQELAYAVVFKNVGMDAGASLYHSHSQLIATDLIPTDVERAVQRMAMFVEKQSQCLFCRMAEDELEQGVRIVEHTPDFIAFCPFASRLPSMVTIIPKRHQSAFQLLEHVELEQLSWLTHRLVRRLERCYPDAAYNFIIHTAPFHYRDSNCFHWRLELFPRITKVAGFEWGSDCYINPLSPEHAAKALRNAGV